MRLFSCLLLWCSVICWTNGLLLDKSGSYILKVKKTGFFVKICGRFSFSTPASFCYSGNSKDDQRHGCSPNYCGIRGETSAENKLLVHYGGGNEVFKENCAILKVEENQQIAQNPETATTKKGSCPWNITEDGKLLVSATVPANSTIHVEEAVFYEVKDSTAAVPIVVYLGCGAAAIICLLIGGGIFYYCHKKKEEKLLNEKENEQENVRNVVTTPKSVESKNSEVNVVGFFEG